MSEETKWESGGKRAFPRITPALPGPAQFTTTKQPPCSHRGTSGQPLSSPWEKHRTLLGWKEEQLFSFSLSLCLSLSLIWTYFHKHICLPKATMWTHTILMTASPLTSWLVIIQTSGPFRVDQATTTCQSTWTSLTNYRLALGMGAVLWLQNDAAEEEKRGMKAYWNPWLQALIVVRGLSQLDMSEVITVHYVAQKISFSLMCKFKTQKRHICSNHTQQRGGRTEPGLLSVIQRQ